MHSSDEDTEGQGGQGGLVKGGAEDRSEPWSPPAAALPILWDTEVPEWVGGRQAGADFRRGRALCP